MTSLGALGNSYPLAAFAGAGRPLELSDKTESTQPVEQSGSAEKSRQVERLESRANSVHARLNYDQDSEEVIIEFIDPKSGEVLRRFPAEQVPDGTRALGSETSTLVRTSA